ncbi:MAG: nitrate reductase molybdenum cofactor assembly chaperone [Alphaproteobacteria bacterium]
MDITQLTSAYRLIAELFLYPEERDAGRIEANMALLEEAPAELRASFEAFLATPASESVDEYISTLELAPLVPLYIGSHLHDEPTSCRGAGMSGRNGYMLELSNIYRHFGVEFAGGEMTDFVPVVVEFLGISLERRDQDQIGLRRYFVETLLIDGVDKLLKALQKCDSPYTHLVEALQTALDEDISLMSDGPIWRPPADQDQVLPAAISGVTSTHHATPEKGVEL